MQGKEATAIYSNEKNPAENLNDNGGWSDFPSFNGSERSFIDPTGFEKPSDNYNTIASSVNEYIHCDLTKKEVFTKPL